MASRFGAERLLERPKNLGGLHRAGVRHVEARHPQVGQVQPLGEVGPEVGRRTAPAAAMILSRSVDVDQQAPDGGGHLRAAVVAVVRAAVAQPVPAQFEEEHDRLVGSRSSSASVSRTGAGLVLVGEELPQGVLQWRLRRTDERADTRSPSAACMRRMATRSTSAGSTIR